MTRKPLEQKTKSYCYYYNHGGDIQRGYNIYPREYGARCEYYQTMFEIKNSLLNPHCNTCHNYQIDKRRKNAKRKPTRGNK